MPQSAYLDAGVPVSGGTDAPVVPYPPVWAFYHFVTRETISGVLGADEKISREDALRLITRRLTQAAGARAAVRTFSARDWVLVTAVENHSGDPLLDGTVQFALERELAKSTFVSVTSRARVVDTVRLMQKPADTVLDETTGREVALRDGEIRALISARIDESAGKYAINARIINPADRRVIAVVDEPAVPRGAVLESVARAGLDLRMRLGEILPAVDKAQQTGLPKVSTASLRALQLYARADAMRNDEGGFGGQEKVAEQLLREAVREDPNFAAAFHLLAIAVRQDGERTRQPRMVEALDLAQRAVALARFGSPTERIRHEGELHAVRFLAHTNGPDNQTHYARALASCEALLRLDANDVDALMGCSSLYAMSDRPHAAFATRLAAIRPKSALWQIRAARALLASKLPQRAEARRYVRKAERLPLTAGGGLFVELGKVRFFVAEQAWIRREAASAQRMVDKVFADSRSLPPQGAYEFVSGAARALLTLGQVKRAESLVAQAHPQSQPNLLATILISRDDPSSLRAALSGRKVEEMTGITTALIEADMLDEARQAIGLLRTRPLMTSDYILMAEGQLAVAEWRYGDAIAAFEEQLRQTLPGTSVMRQWRALNKLGIALAASGQPEKGIALLEAAPAPDAVSSQGLGWGFEWIAMRERLAQLYRQAGRVSDATKVESELLQLLAVADEDHPIKRRLAEHRRAMTAQ